MTIIKIGDGFRLHHFDPEEYRNLPVTVRKYGGAWPELKNFEWMQYASGDDSVIAFARKLHKYRPDIVRHTVQYLNAIIDIEIPEDKISILKTVGSIIPHCDEGRNSTINIGVLNTHSAITHAGNSKDPVDFYLSRTSMRVEEGSCYLLNSGAMHSVDADTKSSERYLISVSFDNTISDMIKRLK